MEDQSFLTIEQIRAGSGAGGQPVYTGRDGWWCAALPTSGAILHVNFAVRDASYKIWFSTHDLARAALEALAANYGATVAPMRIGKQHIEDSADLTPVPGNIESDAWVELPPFQW